MEFLLTFLILMLFSVITVTLKRPVFLSWKICVTSPQAEETDLMPSKQTENGKGFLCLFADRFSKKIEPLLM